jgi:hypothetical protein
VLQLYGNAHRSARQQMHQRKVRANGFDRSDQSGSRHHRHAGSDPISTATVERCVALQLPNSSAQELSEEQRERLPGRQLQEAAELLVLGSKLLLPHQRLHQLDVDAVQQLILALQGKGVGNPRQALAHQPGQHQGNRSQRLQPLCRVQLHQCQSHKQQRQ